MQPELEPIFAGILEGNQNVVRENVQKAVDAGIAPEVILQQGLIPAMTEVGRLFEIGEYFVPEMLIAAHAMQSALSLLQPRLAAAGVQAVGKVVIGTVKGDLHDIGKNLVSMMLKGAGFEVVDLGADVPPDKFVKAIDDKAGIVALSALLTTTMPAMKTTIDALVEARVRSRVKVIIGGAPVTQAYANQIGADGYAPDASSAARLAKSLLDVA